MNSLLLTSVALVATGVAHAATITQTGTFGFVPDGSPQLTFNRFDPSQGTLTAVRVTTSFTKSGGSLSIDNDSDEAASGNVTQVVTVNLGSSGPSLLNASNQLVGNNVSITSSEALSVGPDDGDAESPEGVSTVGPDFATANFATVSTSDTGSIASGGLGSYQGTTPFQFTVGASQLSGSGAFGGAASETIPSRIDGNVTIAYDFTPIPEPSTVFLSLFASLALLRRRRA